MPPVVPPVDEAEWVERVRNGDAAAFEGLFNQYAPGLAGYAYRLLGTQDGAEDIVQALFVDLWLHRERWQLRGSLAAYLYLAVRNRALNCRRHDNVKERRVHVVTGARAAGEHTQPSVDEELDAAETGAAISAAIAALSPQRRTVCTLRWLHGLSRAEIAERLGLTEKTVENHLTDAYKKVWSRVPGLPPQR